jgi:hypothetical protein
MFQFHFLDDGYYIEQNTSFHSNTLYYDNLSIFLFTFCFRIFGFGSEPIPFLGIFTRCGVGKNGTHLYTIITHNIRSGGMA